jgi:hypothetical protein
MEAQVRPLIMAIPKFIQLGVPLFNGDKGIPI